MLTNRHALVVKAFALLALPLVSLWMAGKVAGEVIRVAQLGNAVETQGIVGEIEAESGGPKRPTRYQGDINYVFNSIAYSRPLGALGQIDRRLASRILSASQSGNPISILVDPDNPERIGLSRNLEGQWWAPLIFVFVFGIISIVIWKSEGEKVISEVRGFSQ